MWNYNKCVEKKGMCGTMENIWQIWLDPGFKRVSGKALLREWFLSCEEQADVY